MRGTVESADGVSIVFDLDGRGSPAVVFVHGWSCDRTYWAQSMAQFRESHAVVAVDLAGHGESGTNRDDWSMAAFGDDVAAVVRHLELDHVILVGHSMGGDVVVAASPQLADRVIGLVWVDTYRSLGRPRDDDHVEAVLAPLRADFAAGVRALIGPMVGATCDPKVVEWVLDDMASAPPAIALEVLRNAVSLGPVVAATVPALGVPVVAVNPDDRPTDVESLRAHGVETVTVPGTGHFPMFEDPDTFSTVLAEVIADVGSRAPG